MTVRVFKLEQYQDLDLLELSRQRLMSSVAESTGKTCSQCDGSGTTPTIPTLALKIIRQLEDSLNSGKNNGDITIQSSVDVVTYLLNEKETKYNRFGGQAWS